MSFDDAWIEAELERQLQELGPVSDGESEEDADDFLAPKAYPDEQSRGLEASSGDSLPLDAMPACFREMMSCMQDWEASMVINTKDEIQKSQEAAEDAEKELHKPADSPDVGDLDDEDRDAFTASIVSTKFSHVWWRCSMGLLSVTRNATSDAEEQSTSAILQISEIIPSVPNQGQGSSSAPAQNFDACERSLPVTISAAQDSQIASNPAAIGTPVALRHAGEDFFKEVEEQQRRAEAERLAAVAALEQERIARLRYMEQEERQRRLEMERCREENNMYSEELRLREYYEYKRSCKRREWRAFMFEDRRGSQIRDEDRRLVELEGARLLREEREAETRECRAMIREDEIARRVRDAEREMRERRCMAIAETASFALRDEVWRERERKRFAQADLESQRFREMLLAAMEAQRMAREDEQSSLLRHSYSTLSAGKTSRRRNLAVFGQDPSALVEPVVPSQPSAALAALLQPPANKARPLDKEISAESSGGSNSRRNSRQHSEGSSRQRSIQAASVTASSTLVLDPWESLGQGEAEPSTPSRSRRPSSRSRSLRSSQESRDRKPSPDDGQHNNCCENDLCRAVHNGVERWQRSQSSWRRPPAQTAWPADDPVSTDRGRSPSASSTSRGVSAFAMTEHLGIDEATIGDDCMGDLVKFELREERLDQIPRLASAPHLRILNLVGNRLKSLEPLRECTMLEELSLCQNSLSTLNGLEGLDRLVVLRATANKMVDASHIAQLPRLRDLNLSMNQLESVQWQTPSLVKLALYGNSLVSTSFLQQLPSLTYLDLGRNHLTCVDDRLSEWSPLLTKLYLYENQLASLPELRLPLLTDLVLNKNVLESLGPLGVLPSLDCLQAKYNRISCLALPITGSPLLQTLALTDNQLKSTEALRPVFEFPRLRQLHLKDNPVEAELMEKYRSWVLQSAPQLVELDNEQVADQERLSSARSQFLEDPYFPHQLVAASPIQSSSRSLRGTRGHTRSAGGRGLLGLVDVVSCFSEETQDEGGVQMVQEAPVFARPSVDARDSPCGLTPQELLRERREQSLARWRSSFKIGPLHCDLGGCGACALAIWSEALRNARNAHMVAHLRDERLARRETSREECLLALRRRREFWDTFVEASCNHYEEVFRWRGGCSQVCRVVQFEGVGAERSRQRLLRCVQARWRGILARKRCKLLWVEQRGLSFSDAQLRRFERLQGLCRGVAARQRLRAGGARLPQDVRRELRAAEVAEAATRLQAAVRGLCARRRSAQKRREVEQQRRKLQWARDISKVEDEDDDMAPIDVDQFLGDLDVEALGAVNPFAIQVPEPKAAPVRQEQSSERTGSRRARPPAPLTAWSTPPPTASDPLAGASPAGPMGETNSSMGSPASRAGDTMLPRRSMSMSSTADSIAITESDGFPRGKDPRTARASSDARRKRERPPGLPTCSQTPQGAAPAARGGISRGGSFAGRGNASGRGRGTGRLAQAPPAAGEKKVLKAQDQIAAYLQSQQELQGRQSPDPDALEFSSGPPNRRLTRSAMQSPPLRSESPKARSPRRLAA